MEKTFNKKLRIQLFDKEFNQLSDRLVTQDTEFRKGPDTEHKGPIKLEACLFEQEDIDALITYIQQLRGFIPKEQKVKKAKATTLDTNAEGWRDVLLQEIRGNVAEGAFTTQEELIDFLRGKGFVFLTADFLPEDFTAPQQLEEPEELQYMLCQLREAKNPVNNKYDPMLGFGFTLLGKKHRDTFVFFHNQVVDPVNLKWADKSDTLFKKTDMAKFPTYLTLEEREKFRIELYKLRKDPDLVPSKFFKRWYSHIEFREREEWADRMTKE